MVNLFNQIFGRRRRPSLPKVVNERELAAMFLEAPNSKLWQATLAALDNQVQASVDDCLDESLSNEVLRARVGVVAGLLQFRATLEDYEKRARETEEQARQRAETEGESE